ncbi:GDSL esterase/lipase 5-like isoform X2 [Actinidia eriantha]|uniref:GDSL esterase/lipase 5-like isoform X2 n=1 Tax=Actinidia eriantha TaxID=165200 RepID=UPI00259057E0|nr:GDSL esterase/lipase 5-like isoform X2 [Actinidia eriantha]
MARSSSSSSSFILILFMLFTPIFSLRECQQRRLEGGGKVALYIFGDSLFDSGNNNYIHTTPLDQANFWPYGETFFNFPTGRFSDGRLMSDFIGAGALVETFQGAVINLSTQLRNYKKVVRWLRGKLGDGEADTSLSRAVYLFSIGSNDYMSPFLTNSSVLTSYSNSNYVAMVIGNLTMAIKEVYLRGGRKFGFLNLGPLGCLPGLRMIQQEANGSCLEEKASTLAMLHNEALSKLLSNLETQLKGLIYALYDFNTNLGQRMNHPSKYGFKEGKSACCGTGRFRGTFSCGGKRPVKEFELCESPNEYVFWDTFHLTEKFYKQMADQMWAGGPPAVKPYNLKSLFQCLD